MSTLKQTSYLIEARAVRFCTVISVASMFLYAGFGLASLGFINLYDSSITWVDNFLPRILFVSLPFFILSIFLSKSKATPRIKLHVWLIFFVLINVVSACIHVWPLAMDHPEIILWVAPTNSLIFVGFPFIAGFTGDLIIKWALAFTAFFHLPILMIVSQNEIYLFWFLNQTFLDLVLLAGFGVVSTNLRDKIEKALISEIDASKKFLHDDIKANVELASSEESSRKGFNISIDVRGYTDFCKRNTKAKDLTKELNSLVRKHARMFGCVLHKSAGDGFIAYRMEKISISDIEELLESVEKEKLYRSSLKNMISFFESVCLAFEDIRHKYNAQELYICGGIDFGTFEFFVVGDQDSLEYDMYSLCIHQAKRLEEFSKVLITEHGPGSYLVLSPQAYEFCNEEDKVSYYETRRNYLIRNFTEINKVAYLRFNEERRRA